ncbi:MAG: hypothetical protein WAO50_09445 [Candidatus Nanopelagicales bacterium]|nr:hypothetical protein [Candidatus Nanopelagicales bacterium]MCF8557393.1 hypothetical protein [Candidatus Nanopelagicales bacterium]
MDGREQSWRDRVAQAALARDADALRALYAEATELFGSEAGAHWAQALSAYDASAVTG